jgi:hypothetical protein
VFDFTMSLAGTLEFIIVQPFGGKVSSKLSEDTQVFSMPFAERFIGTATLPEAFPFKDFW